MLENLRSLLEAPSLLRLTAGQPRIWDLSAILPAGG